MKVYNFVENKNVLALFPTLRQLLAAVRRGGAPRPGWTNNCHRLHPTKLSTVSFTDVVVVFTFDIVLNSCILNCFVFSLYASSSCFLLSTSSL